MAELHGRGVAITGGGGGIGLATARAFLWEGCRVAVPFGGRISSKRRAGS